MAFDFQDLDDATRVQMLAEFDFDVSRDAVYCSGYFSPTGIEAYPDLCRTALADGTDDTLAASLNHRPYWLTQVPRRTRSGGMTMAAVRRDAHIMFAEGEFNRMYMRGLCQRVLADGRTELDVYRARLSQRPRADSVALIDQAVDAGALLDDLRENIGLDTHLGLAQPNSGLSVRRPDYLRARSDGL